MLSPLATFEESICYSIGEYGLIDSNHIIQTEIEEYKIRIDYTLFLLVNILSDVGFKKIQLLKANDVEFQW